jgi:hypothetical protein
MPQIAAIAAGGVNWFRSRVRPPLRFMTRR